MSKADGDMGGMGYGESATNPSPIDPRPQPDLFPKQPEHEGNPSYHVGEGPPRVSYDYSEQPEHEEARKLKELADLLGPLDEAEQEIKRLRKIIDRCDEEARLRKERARGTDPDEVGYA